MEGHIIAVDDDQSILDMLTLALEWEGYHVDAFNSPGIALEAAQADPPDAIVTDLMMPVMNGVDLIQALRQNPQTQDTPIVLCSAYYGDLACSSLELGHDRTIYLRKPFQLQDLLDAVSRMMPCRADLSPDDSGHDRVTPRPRPVPISTADVRKSRAKPGAAKRALAS